MDLVDTWVRISRRDARGARVMLEAGDPENALYLAQQAVEKALKAHIQHNTSEHPPKIHSLPRLAEASGLLVTMGQPQRELLLNLDEYAIAGRYSATLAGMGPPPEEERVREMVSLTEELVEWLLQELK